MKGTVGMSAGVISPKVELNFHGVSGNWKILGKTEAVCSFALGEQGPRMGL